MFRSALFFNTIQTKQPATCRCLEEGDVFRVNAVSQYEQRNHILTLDTRTKGTQISLFVQIPVETSLLIISTFLTLYENKIFNEIFYMIVLTMVQKISRCSACQMLQYFQIQNSFSGKNDRRRPSSSCPLNNCIRFHPPLQRCVVYGHEDHEIHNCSPPLQIQHTKLSDILV